MQKDVLAILILLAFAVTGALSVAINFLVTGTHENEDENPSVSPTTTPASSGVGAYELPFVPYRQGMSDKVAPSDNTWISYSQVNAEGEALVPNATMYFIHANGAAGVPTTYTAGRAVFLNFQQSADQKFSLYNGRYGHSPFWDVTKELGENAGYFFRVKWKGDYTRRTAFTKATCIFPFKGQGIGFMQQDWAGNGLGGMVSVSGGANITANSEAYDFSPALNKVYNQVELNPPLDPSADYPSFLVMNWNRVDERLTSTQVEFQFVTKANANAPYVTQKATSQTITSEDNSVGGYIYVPSLERGPTVWGGSNVFPGEILTEADILQACQTWENWYMPKFGPEILSAAQVQIFYEDEVAQNRGYPNPVVKTTGNAEDNKFQFTNGRSLPDNLGLSLDPVTGGLIGTPKAEFAGQVDLLLVQTALNQYSNIFPVQVLVKPPPYIRYEASSFTFYTATGGTVPPPELNGYTGVTTSDSISGITLNADGSVTVDTSVAVGVYQLNVQGIAETGVSAKVVLLTIDVEDKPDVVLQVKITYPQTTTYIYNQTQVANIAPTFTISGLPDGVVAQPVFASTPLPQGLTLDTTTGIISRINSIVMVPQAMKPYSVSVTINMSDQGLTYKGFDADEFTIGIRGIVDSPFSSSITVGAKVDYTIKYDPPALSEGTTIYTTFEPPLPIGLGVNGRKIAGTTTSVSQQTLYNVRSFVEEKDGTTVEANGRFVFAVVAADEPQLVDNSNDNDWYYMSAASFVLFALLVACMMYLALMFQHTKEK